MAFLWHLSCLFGGLKFIFEKVSQGSPCQRYVCRARSAYSKKKKKSVTIFFLGVRLSVQNISRMMAHRVKTARKKISKNCFLDWLTLKLIKLYCFYQLFSRNVCLLLNNMESLWEQWLLLVISGDWTELHMDANVLQVHLKDLCTGTGNYFLCRRRPTPLVNNRALCVFSPVQWAILRNVIKESTEWNTLM